MGNFTPEGADSGSVSGSLSSDLIRVQLRKILSNERFSSAHSIRRFLEFAVNHTLEDRGDSIKEYQVGVDVFDRGDQFDPRIDPIVRVQAVKLRTKLREYYENEGSNDAILIEFPKGAYVPVFRRREAPPEKQDSTAPVDQILPRQEHWPRSVLLFLAGITLLALAGGTWLLRTSVTSQGPNAPPARLTSDTGHTSHPAVSRDGRWLAYSSDRGEAGVSNIWVQPVTWGEPVQLTHYNAAHASPDFSPDGTRIVFRSFRTQGGIYSIPTLGGEERFIAEGGYNPRFSPDGKWIAYGTPSGIFVVSAAGGEPRRLDPGLDSMGCPIWSPDGRHLIFLADRSDGKFDWWVAPFPDSGTSQRRPAVKTTAAEAVHKVSGTQFNDATCPSDWLGNEVIFTLIVDRMGSLWRIPLSFETWQPTGPARQVVPGPGVDFARVWRQQNQPARLVFANENRTSHIWSLPLDANRGKTVGRLLQLTRDTSLVPGLAGTRPSLSGDGAKLLFSSSRTGNLDIWMKDLVNGKESALTTDPRPEDAPALSPDGHSLAFRMMDSGKQAILLMDSDRRSPRPLCADCGEPKDWFQDGVHLLYIAGSPPGLFILNTQNGERRALSSDRNYAIRQAAIAPDQHWLAVSAVKTGEDRERGFLVPLDGLQARDRKAWIPVVDQPFHLSLHWSPNGDIVYFFMVRDNFRCLWAQALEPRTKRPKGEPFAVHHFHSAQRYPWYGSWIAVTRDKIALNLTEATSNIWTAGIPETP